VSLIVALGAGGPKSHVADWSSRLITEAGKRGDKLVIVDRADNLASVPAAHPAIAASVEADFANVDAVRAALVPYLGKTDAVIGFREYSLLPTAILAREYGTPWNNVQAVETCRHKDQTRELLHSQGFNQPSVRRFASRADALGYLGSLRSPVIVKPRDAFGSQGVCLVRSPGEIPSAVDQGFSFSSEILVEDYVVGSEYSVEGVFVNGTPQILASTKKTVTPPPRFVELQHEQPSNLAPETESLLHTTVVSAVSAVGLTHSLFHVEAWVTDSGEIVCGEVHGRVGGDWIHALTSYRRPGLEIFGVVLDDVLGRAVELPPLDTSRAATSVVVQASSGRVVAVGGVPRLPDGAILLAEDWSLGVGDEVSALNDSFGRAAILVIGAETCSVLNDAVRKVRDSVVITSEEI
jgi:phosphoribosylaminoimidazole carboxylase (NCAIR synthetase)